MTDPTATPQIVRKLVVIFDICSSTSILEDLIRTENQICWQKLLGQLKRFLWSQRAQFPFHMYKFLGDGWILLFDDGAVSGRSLISFMKALCNWYDDFYHKEITDLLSSSPRHVGVTFGVDEGSLLRIVMNRQEEFVGRPINVAARLQSATKQLKAAPPGALLISKNAYSRLKLRVRNEPVTCNLANVTGGDKYQARKVQVYRARPNSRPEVDRQ